ncbi:hypothetical protein [Curtobacterium sp. PhB115]|uniref:hypothetical protein n=1 Tax=Curtobacterium sp. PhB115 TaxID=2485173 RepID=UPI000F4C782E|nr:hypothetical protein [Curtobacterium sp. PhB115]
MSRHVVDLEKYDTLWAAAHPRFEAGDLQPDREPVEGDPRWGISLVLLPPDRTARTLADAAEELGAAYDGAHHVYGEADLHLTVTSLEPYSSGADPSTIEHYVRVVEASRDLLDVRVRLVGLGGSAAGVFVQGFDDDTLRPLRARMRAAAGDLHDGTAPPMAFVRDTAHISLSVHRQATPEPAAARLVEGLRRRDFGTMDGGRIALVCYRPRGGSMGIEVLHAMA